MPEEAMAIMVETKYFQVWHKIDRVLMAYPDHHTQEVILNVNDLKEEKATWSIRISFIITLSTTLLMEFFRSQIHSLIIYITINITLNYHHNQYQNFYNNHKTTTKSLNIQSSNN